MRTDARTLLGILNRKKEEREKERKKERKKEEKEERGERERERSGAREREIELLEWRG